MQNILIWLSLFCAGLVIGCIIGSVCGKRLFLRMVISKNKAMIKNIFLYNVCGSLLLLREKNVDLSSFFAENGLKRIAVYGMGRIGQSFIELLKDTDYAVSYGIDRNKPKGIVPVYGLDENLPEADIVVVTIWEIKDVKETLIVNEGCRIVGIKDILDVVLDGK